MTHPSRPTRSSLSIVQCQGGNEAGMHMRIKKNDNEVVIVI